jgi:hypothetical protein
MVLLPTLSGTVVIVDIEQSKGIGWVIARQSAADVSLTSSQDGCEKISFACSVQR